MIDGASAMADGSFERTLYTGCYSARTRSYYHSTYEDPSITCIAMDDLLARCDDKQKLVAEQ